MRVVTGRFPLHCSDFKKIQTWIFPSSTTRNQLKNTCNLYQIGKLLNGTVWKKMQLTQKKSRGKLSNAIFLFNSKFLRMVVGPVSLFPNRFFSNMHLPTRNQQKCTCNLQCRRQDSTLLKGTLQKKMQRTQEIIWKFVKHDQYEDLPQKLIF